MKHWGIRTPVVYGSTGVYSGVSIGVGQGGTKEAWCPTYLLEVSNSNKAINQIIQNI